MVQFSEKGPLLGVVDSFQIHPSNGQDGGNMSKIAISDLKDFCRTVLQKEGMKNEYATIVADVLSETDAFGIHSHGTKNLPGYIQKIRAGGIDIHAEPEIILNAASLATIDARRAIGMVPAVQAMDIACQKANHTGLALITVFNSCHFGAAGYYANMAAKRGMIGIAMSNVDPNMTIPGARGMVIGNNPFAYAAPMENGESMFLDIAMSNVASLKVVQARKDRRQIPDNWIVDKNGVPTTDPSHYPEEGAMQPMAAHKGYGLAILVDLLTAVLSNGCTSMEGQISSWCFDMERPNNVCHAFLAIDPQVFPVGCGLSARVFEMARALRNAPKAQDSTRIFTPGEIEWSRHRRAEQEGISLPSDLEMTLQQFSHAEGIPLSIKEA